MNPIRTPIALCILLAAFSFTVACQKSPRPASKITPSEEARKEPARVLFLLTSASTQMLQNGKTRQTGYFLSEFYEPYRALQERGHVLSIATPNGAPAAIDPEGLQRDYWPDANALAQAREFARTEKSLDSPLSLDEAIKRIEEWDGLVIPGGQGVMVDVYRDDRARDLLALLGERQRAVGLICHAPALLARLNRDNPFEGRRVTAVSPFEEFFIETFIMSGKAQERKIGRSLARAGYDYDSALPKANHAIRDCNLVTSQNPFSGEAFIRKFVPALEDAKRGNPCAHD